MISSCKIPAGTGCQGPVEAVPVLPVQELPWQWMEEEKRNPDCVYYRVSSLPQLIENAGKGPLFLRMNYHGEERQQGFCPGVHGTEEVQMTRREFALLKAPLGQPWISSGCSFLQKSRLGFCFRMTTGVPAWA